MDGPRTSATATLAAAALLLAPALAHGALRADRVRVVDGPGRVRVLVHLAGAPPPAGMRRAAEVVDPRPLDGRASVRVTAPGITAAAGAATSAGVIARVVGAPGSVVVRMTARPRSLKFVRLRVSTPRGLLIIDLMKVTTRIGARILDDGCLSLRSWSARGGRAAATGRERGPLPQHGFLLTVRGRDGMAIAERSLTATRGSWAGAVRIPGPAAGSRAMLEAWTTSARDGSLQCLVQTPVIIRP